MSDESKYILELRNVSYRDPSSIISELSNVDLKLSPSNLVMILLEKHNVDVPLNDLAQGLLMPSEGTVQFLGNQWCSMSPDVLSESRGRVGRVFTGSILSITGGSTRDTPFQMSIRSDFGQKVKRVVKKVNLR